MSLSKRDVAPQRSHSEDVVVFHVGDMSLAIAARDVDEIRNIAGLTPRSASSGRVPQVESTLSRTKDATEHTIYVVNSAMHFGVKSATPSRLLVLRDHPVALLADAIDRMQQVSQLHPLPQAFHGAEREWYRGLAVLDGKVIPMVQPGSFLKREELEILAPAKIAVVSA